MKKVLIVDDDVDVTKFVSRLVERTGYKAIVAKNGVEGMGKVREDKLLVGCSSATEKDF
jgi:CheY-like chemotaxis protein